MSKPMSEAELKDKLADYAYEVYISKDMPADEQDKEQKRLLDIYTKFLLADRKAWGEYIVGSDFRPNDFDNRWVRHIPPSTTHYETEEAAKILNDGFSEIRQRNENGS